MKQYIQYDPETGAIKAAVRSAEAPLAPHQIELDVPITIFGRVVDHDTGDVVDLETGYILNKETGHFEPDSTPTSDEAGFLARLRAWFGWGQ